MQQKLLFDNHHQDKNHYKTTSNEESQIEKRQKLHLTLTNQGYELYRQLANRKARKRKVSQATSF